MSQLKICNFCEVSFFCTLITQCLLFFVIECINRRTGYVPLVYFVKNRIRLFINETSLSCRFFFLRIRFSFHTIFSISFSTQFYKFYPNSHFKTFFIVFCHVAVIILLILSFWRNFGFFFFNFFESKRMSLNSLNLFIWGEKLCFQTLSTLQHFRFFMK